MNFRLGTAFFVLFSVFSSSGQGQTVRGVIEGVVRDQAQKPMPSAYGSE